MVSLVTNFKGSITIQIDKAMAEKLYDILNTSSDGDIVKLKEKIEKQFEWMSRTYVVNKS